MSKTTGAMTKKAAAGDNTGIPQLHAMGQATLPNHATLQSMPILRSLLFSAFLAARLHNSTQLLYGRRNFKIKSTSPLQVIIPVCGRKQLIS
uniref:Uncharacterized protein n=1 Tax=Arundo donax TaxID=35708 RepID=A0A0A9GAS4_ARUDO